MKSLFVVLVALGMFVAIAMPVSGEWYKGAVAKIVEKVKMGEGFREASGMPIEQRQIFRFSFYLLDIKAQLCFAEGQSLTLVPCEALKKGYPLIAPLITWVK